jgi:hypothetical protein
MRASHLSPEEMSGGEVWLTGSAEASARAEGRYRARLYEVGMYYLQNSGF